MSVDEKEEMEGKTEVEESESKSSSPQGLIKLDEAAVQVNANIVGDQELKVLPGNKEEDKVVEVKDTGRKKKQLYRIYPSKYSSKVQILKR
jgi:hypothetical protein